MHETSASFRWVGCTETKSMKCASINSKPWASIDGRLISPATLLADHHTSQAFRPDRSIKLSGDLPTFEFSHFLRRPQGHISTSLRAFTGTMSIGPSLLQIHERPNGDISLSYPQKEDVYILRASKAEENGTPPIRGSCTQEIVRCADGAVLANVVWVEPKKDLVRFPNGLAGMDAKTWVRLDEAWKAAEPTRGDW